MTEQSGTPATEMPLVTEEALLKAQEFIEEEEGAANRLAGWRAALVTLMAIAVSLYHLYAAYGIVPAQVLRPVHVAHGAVPDVPAVSRWSSAFATASCGGTSSRPACRLPPWPT